MNAERMLGQLGLGVTSETVSSPQEVIALRGKEITAMSCGEDFSVVGTTSGVYTFGKGDVGQLNGEVSDDIKLPRLLKADIGNVTQLASGWGFSIALTGSYNILEVSPTHRR